MLLVNKPDSLMAAWKLANAYQVQYTKASLSAEEIKAPKRLHFPPGAKLFGKGAFGGKLQLKPAEEDVLAAGFYYPTSFSAALRANAELRFQHVIPPESEGKNPFYMMDEEFTVRQLMGLLLLHDEEAAQFWRFPHPGCDGTYSQYCRDRA